MTRPSQWPLFLAPPLSTLHGSLCLILTVSPWPRRCLSAPSSMPGSSLLAVLSVWVSSRDTSQLIPPLFNSHLRWCLSAKPALKTLALSHPLFHVPHRNMMLLGQQEGSTGKSTHGQVWQPVFDLWGSQGRREITPTNYPLTSICMPRHKYTHTHT